MENSLMIKNVEYVANRRTLIKVNTDNGKFCISYKDIRPYWRYATPSDFEWGKVKTHGDYLIFTMLTASDQGGVVCVWDCRINKLIHISEGAYVIAVALANDKVYMLKNVYHWGLAPHLCMSTIPLGTINTDDYGKPLYADKPDDVKDFRNEIQNSELFVENGKISIQFGDQNVLFTSDESKATVMNKKFSMYYPSPDETSEQEQYRKEKLIFWMLL